MTQDHDIEATIIKHTKFQTTELITLEVNLHRSILAQLNTHKALSRNYQSSRAMPVMKQLEQIRENPAMPVYYGTAKKGMVAGDELTGMDLQMAIKVIDDMRLYCIQAVEDLHSLGLSKEIANRYVEPWMYTKGVVTATKEAWEAFFKLRCEYDAQSEIRVLADSIKDAIESSVPEVLKVFEWHLPYINLIEGKYYIGDREISLDQAIKVSCSACAQVSYRTLNLSTDKADSIYSMLNLPEGGEYSDKGNPHFSPAEHLSMATDWTDMELLDPMQNTEWLHGYDYSGNLHTPDFMQYRKCLEYGFDKQLLKNNN